MKVLLALVLLALVVVIIVLVLRGRSASQQPVATPAPADPLAQRNDAGDPRSLRAGDMVEYLGTLYFCRGSLRLTEGGFSWSEHFLDDSQGKKRWLSVEEDPDLEVVMWTETDAEVDPNLKTVTYDGVSYRKDEHGTAKFTSEGTTGLGQSGQMEYVDYEGPSGTYLSLERFGGGEWEVGLGDRVPLSALTVYPSSGGRPAPGQPGGQL